MHLLADYFPVAGHGFHKLAMYPVHGESNMQLTDVR